MTAAKAVAPGHLLARFLKSISHRQTITLNRLERLEKMVAEPTDE